MSVMDKFLLGMNELRFNLDTNDGVVTNHIKAKALEMIEIMDVMDKCRILLIKILQERTGDKIIENYYNLL